MVLQRGPKYVENNNNYNIIMLRIFKRSTDAFLWTYISSSLTDWTGRWRGWLRHSETSRKVVGSSPMKPGRNMTLGSTHPLTEMSTKDTSRGRKLSVCMADSPTNCMCRLYGNVRASVCWNHWSLCRSV